MAYVIIVVVLLIIIGPILAVLPSKRQKEQMLKRQTAMAAGLSVALTRIEDPDPNPEDYLSNTGKPLERVKAVIAYRLPRQRLGQWHQTAVDWALERKLSQSPGPRDTGLPTGWHWSETQAGQLPARLRQYLQVAIADLPNDVVRVEERKNIISAYWNERGDTIELTKLIDFLRDCAALPVAPEDDDSAPNDDH